MSKFNSQRRPVEVKLDRTSKNFINVELDFSFILHFKYWFKARHDIS